MPYIDAQALAIAQRRIDALPTETAALDRRDALRETLATRGTSAVALAELHLLEEVCAGIEAEWAAQAQAECDAENAWLRAAEAPTNEDYAFERYEAEMGLS